MTQYVNAESFLNWYDSVHAGARPSDQEVLDQVVRQFQQTRREEFVLPAEQTKSGREERCPFRFEHLNCCGADRVIISF